MNLNEFFIRYGVTKTREVTLKKHKSIPNPKYDPTVSYGHYPNNRYSWHDKPWQKTITVTTGTETVKVPDLWMRNSEKQYMKVYGMDELESWVLIPGIEAWARVKMKIQPKKGEENTKWLYIVLRGDPKRPTIQMSNYDHMINTGMEFYNAAVNIKPEISVTDSFRAEAIVAQMEDR